MSKIQLIKRKDGSDIYLVYLPNEEVISSGFQKGDRLEIKSSGAGKMEMNKVE